VIKVEITKDSYIKRVKVHGHANFSEHGSDIVCSAASSMTILTVNALYKFGLGPKCEIISNDEGLIDIKVLNNDVIIQTLLENLVDNFTELENDYRDYIRIIK